MGEEKRNLTDEQADLKSGETDGEGRNLNEAPDVEGHIVRVSPPVDHKRTHKRNHKRT